MSNDTQPEIRFPGFTEAWEQRKLGEVSPLRGGFAFKSYKFVKEGIPIVRISNILSNGSVGGEFVYYTAQEKDENYLLPDKSALLAMSGATTGKVSILNNPNNNKVYQNQRVGYFTKTKNVDYSFISTLVRSKIFLDQLNSVLVAGAQPNISSKDINVFELTIPKNIEEQKKIGNFFKQLDDTIALHQRKLDLLKETKKGFLQKMFPKNGAKVPEIRFPGFTEDWEQRKLGDVTAEVFQGINTAGDKVEYSDTGTPILQAKHITGGDVTFDEARFLDKERYSNYFPKYVPVENDILFANIGTIGPSTVVRDESEFLVAWNILKITLKKPEIAEFIQLQLDQLNQKHYFDSVLTGNATKFVNKDEMLRTPISVPTIEEQKKVGAFFSNIQRAITLHQRKLDLLKETKKGFLQKMFV